MQKAEVQRVRQAAIYGRGCRLRPFTPHFAFLPRRVGAQGGSAIVYVMLTVSVLSVVAASLLLTNVSRYQTTFQSASWQEAIVGAEAGVDLAINELRKRVVTGPGVSFQGNWSTTNPQTGKAYGDFGRAFPAAAQPYALTSHGGEGNTATQVRVFIDVPGCDAGANFAQANDDSFISQVDNPQLRDPDGVDRSRWLFRIRSLGVTGVTGPPRPGLDKLDNALRRLSFFNDWRTGRRVDSPQTARLVEAVVRPQTGFRNALMADVRIDLNDQDVLIDSYDSSKGNYDSKTNHGQMGNVATNGQLINAGHAIVNGNAMTNNGDVKQGENVSGQQSSSFYQELTPLTVDTLNPGWSNVKDAGTVTTSQTYVASSNPNAPTLVRMDAINLPDTKQVLSVNAPSSTTSSTVDEVPQSYVKFYVQGDLTTAGSSSINLAAGVNAIFYVAGNVNLQGNGIINNSYLPGHLVLNGIRPAANRDGSFPSRTITIATGQDFQGIVYAPNHDLGLALQAVSTGVLTPVTSIPPKIQAQIDKLERDAVKADQDAAKAMIDYNNDMARYNQSLTGPGGLIGPLAGPLAGINPDYAKAQQDLAKAQQATAKAASLRQQEITLQGQYTQAAYEDHARGYNGIYGGFVARTIKVESKTHVHYDETLRTAGPVNHYEVVNWFEDDLSRNSAGGPETFWW